MIARWAVCLWVAMMLVAVGVSAAPRSAVVEPRQADFIVSDQVVPPADSDPRWRAVTLPDNRKGSNVWYRIDFDRPQGADSDPWAVYLPYLYRGGKLWLNGELVAAVQEASSAVSVRWERPHLLPLSIAGLRAGRNRLLLRVAWSEDTAFTDMPRLAVGPQAELEPRFDRRLFWVRTVPLITVVAGTGAGIFFLLIWWQRRDEKLYGLFGVAVLMWAVRTNTFTFDTLPASWWPTWRFAYHLSTGGFVLFMALFALALAGWYRRRVAMALLGYWLIGPLVFLLSGGQADAWVSRWWTAGLIPIGLGLIGVSAAAAWRQRSVATIVLAAAMALAVASGVHDYLLAWNSPWLASLAPDWVEQRIFLLHHGANVLLIVMVALLSARFVRTLRDVEDINRTLEGRVSEREREIGASYERIAAMQRERAVADERQRITQDLHDGLGSQLLISLLKVERGALAPAGVAEMLRVCIADMRLAIEVLASQDEDFRSALGNFLFRWEAQLREAGIASSWQIEAPDASLEMSPHTALQVLRVLQEALTNVVKHARASHVSVRLSRTDKVIRLDVEDNGRGFPAETATSYGRGMANMRARAERLGALLEIGGEPGATRVSLALPAVGR